MSKEKEKVLSDIVYIYNVGQINYYLECGLKPLQVGQGKLGDTYAVFDYHEHKQIFPKWLKIQSTFQMINLNDVTPLKY